MDGLICYNIPIIDWIFASQFLNCLKLLQRWILKVTTSFNISKFGVRQISMKAAIPQNCRAVLKDHENCCFHPQANHQSTIVYSRDSKAMSDCENPRFTERTSTNLGRSHRLTHVCTIMIYGKLGGYRLQETAAFIYIYM